MPMISTRSTFEAVGDVRVCEHDVRCPERPPCHTRVSIEPSRQHSPYNRII